MGDCGENSNPLYILYSKVTPLIQQCIHTHPYLRIYLFMYIHVFEENGHSAPSVINRSVLLSVNANEHIEQRPSKPYEPVVLPQTVQVLQAKLDETATQVRCNCLHQIKP